MTIDRWIALKKKSGDYSTGDIAILTEIAEIAADLQCMDAMRLPVGCCTMHVGVPPGGHVKLCPFNKLREIEERLK